MPFSDQAYADFADDGLEAEVAAFREQQIQAGDL